MSRTTNILENRLAQVAAELEPLQTELREIQTALDAIRAQDISLSQVESSKLPINDAILEAIRNGQSKPADIHKFLADHLRVHTTRNSVNTRLSKLKKEGVIKSGENGWEVDTNKEPNGSGLFSMVR